MQERPLSRRKVSCQASILGKVRSALERIASDCNSCCGPAGVCGYGEDFCGVGCSSNCDAVAMCGKFSEGGNTKCGMNLCCSWGKSLHSPFFLWLALVSYGP